LIGQAFPGIVTSDRYSAYRWTEVSRWQVCWAHLKRDFTAMAERSGVSREIGNEICYILGQYCWLNNAR
jgi:hypothetical protein